MSSSTIIATPVPSPITPVPPVVSTQVTVRDSVASRRASLLSVTGSDLSPDSPGAYEITYGDASV